ncbi:Reverse transcriptase, RNA-dependent DNA polymerase [Metarhizium guizhouense ARSEF 977]|uniref:Reverse transcriptase, RNA-dependent DNA polymerase n=1 Tax=Metarhizium guizhouense (strain ARSEF 977) TaxID=1276136 RepID=A0A0B4G874_METGA|nr:Reverse transcriptase, RNA-dependent DNA polymerase [Metarhizium guizhouense ARSEF 977]
MYKPEITTTLPDSEQNLSITINEVDLDEEDMELLPVMENTTASVPVSIQPETELPPAGLPLTPQISPEPATTGEIQVVEHVDKSPGMPRPPSPISLHHASPRPQTDISNANTPKKERVTDASVLQNLRTASGRNIKLSQKGQDAIETLKTSYAQPQIHKRSLEEKGTFKLVDYPEDKQVLPLKWVFTYKLDDAGYLIRHKARICVRGDLQHHTGDDIYAATGAYRSFRILMALVCAFGLICHQIDFKNAFINAHMDEEVYTTCPPGYGKSGKVWKLRRALYGLRKSPKLWFNELVTFLQGLGFEYCPDEPCILVNNETHLILFLYVDDLLIISHQEYLHQVNEFKTAVHRKYGIKDLGEAISFLNIRILRDIKAKKLWISQDGYIDKLKVKFGIDQKQKLEPRAHIGYLVGYQSSNIYKIWVPHKNRVILTRDVIFNESTFFEDRIAQPELRQTISQLLEEIEIPEEQQVMDSMLEEEETVGSQAVITSYCSSHMIIVLLVLVVSI